MIGSFTIGGATINVDSDYSHIDGVFYKLIEAGSQHQVAVTTYRGLNVADGRFSKAELQDGLRTVLRRASQRPPGRREAPRTGSG